MTEVKKDDGLFGGLDEKAWDTFISKIEKRKTKKSKDTVIAKPSKIEKPKTGVDSKKFKETRDVIIDSFLIIADTAIDGNPGVEISDINTMLLDIMSDPENFKKTFNADTDKKFNVILSTGEVATIYKKLGLSEQLHPKIKELWSSSKIGAVNTTKKIVQEEEITIDDPEMTEETIDIPVVQEEEQIEVELERKPAIKVKKKTTAKRSSAKKNVENKMDDLY